MVDFKSLVGTTKAVTHFDLEKLYASLDVKGTHTELRTAQKEALTAITSRHEEHDLILKISTGSGKTTVGLLYLLGYMRQSRGAGVYLCPTLQLVEQVIVEAGKLGIQAYDYPSGEPFPNPACARGEAVLVCTYEKLFNARTTFNRNDVNLVPAAIVLDDAHTGAENVRKQFTLRVHGEAYQALMSLLEARCKAYHPTKWSDLQQGDPSDLLEVPHWIWTDVATDVRTVLHTYADEQGFPLVWPFLESVLPECRCVLSGTHAEICPEIIPLDMVRPYSRAQHRLFMSATLADDSLLVREFDASESAATNPIIPPSDRGLGERMILAPNLVSPELDRGYVIDLCVDLSKVHSVVVLTSSEFLSRDWVDAGAAYFEGNDVKGAVRDLRNGTLKFAVFSQRYDGVDLADDACRILVIDGLPFGDGLLDKVDAQLAFRPGGVRNKTIFRIEQGMGRAVRSHADYAVVLLVGQDIATYVGRSDVQEAMTQGTKGQLELCFELAGLVKASGGGDAGLAVKQVISQCLSRDTGWKEFYNQRIREMAKFIPEISAKRIQLASSERKAYSLAMNNTPSEGVAMLRLGINGIELPEDEKGIYLQRLARLAYLVDPSEGMRIQQAARQYCPNVAIPPALPIKIITDGAKPAAQNMCVWLKQFATLNAAVIEATKLRDMIDFSAKYRTIERLVHELGSAIGATSSRPETEYSRGPDNLWHWGDKLYVIEVKSEIQDSLHKKDSGQLHDSIEWANANYPELADRTIPVVVTNVEKTDDDAHFPPNTRLLSQEGLKAIASSLRQLCTKIALQGPVFVTPDNIHKEILEFGLGPEAFGRYSTILGRS